MSFEMCLHPSRCPDHRDTKPQHTCIQPHDEAGTALCQAGEVQVLCSSHQDCKHSAQIVSRSTYAASTLESQVAVPPLPSPTWTERNHVLSASDVGGGHPHDSALRPHALASHQLDGLAALVKVHLAL